MPHVYLRWDNNQLISSMALFLLCACMCDACVHVYYLFNTEDPARNTNMNGITVSVLMALLLIQASKVCHSLEQSFIPFSVLAYTLHKPYIDGSGWI